ncbi:ROK family protein [Streptomyces griseofuscus]|uniref:Sugar kinase n=1 Tax=Streptomyces griseofuscus TaxID=146922 RepID=A0A426S628_9ACTN|nr:MULTISPECIES: ROK family transcriptional regulator [Streptomyces]MBA9045854.1 putative NBD/HSP70 family sugar kinase [Streptomyces murinus]RRQ79294.1 sugar kinase [Streptomyces griseofuscus]RRQ85204.1 sugar kinase [Streptomyces griseofuscus]BBC96002.1 ROK family protein [Streptomyces rochei]
MPRSAASTLVFPVSPVPRAAERDRRRTSASSVLRSVLEHGPVARSTVARLTGLSPASVTEHCARLAGLGLIRESPAPRRSRGVGRPHVPVELDDARFVVGGVHVAVPYTTVALLDLRGRVLARRELKHERTDPGRVLARAAEGLAALFAEASGRRPLGVGVAVGGWVDRETGTVVEHELLGWREVPVRELLAARTGLPVQVDGHARALVNGERLFGRARGSRSVLHLFVGNVVDAAFATHDEVHHGPRSAAGAIAHLPVPGGTEPCPCGRTGCLQVELGERTLCRRARAAGVTDSANPMHVVAAAAAGDAVARRLLVERARATGRAAALLLDVLNPETVVVTEVGVIHFEECLDALREAAGNSRSAAVLPTSFPDSVLAVAGGSVLLDALFRDPLGASPEGI